MGVVSGHSPDSLDPIDPVALVEEFASGYPFDLDDFQRRGCLALASGQSTLVAAPTGAGKTVVGSSRCGWRSARAARRSTPRR